MTKFRSALLKFAAAPVAVAALAAPTALVVTAESAAASAPCWGVPSGDKDRSTWVPQTPGWSGRQRAGSFTSCSATGWADNEDILNYYCYTANPDGSSWTYLENLTDGSFGWVNDNLLPVNSAGGRGSFVYCGF
jgi:hypothetical protein